MTNLNRALRMAFKYRWSLIGSFICSLMVAVLWCANLGAVYPLVEVVLHNKSLHTWADEQTTESSDIVSRNAKRIAELQDELVKNPAIRETHQRQIKLLNAEIRVHERRLKRIAWLSPLIKKYLPDDPFQTLVFVMCFMLVGTVVRGLFLMGNMVAVARVGKRTILDIQNLVFENVLKMEVSELGVGGTGDLVNRIRGESNAIGKAITTLFGKTVREPLKMMACIAGAAAINWRLLLLSMIVCPIAGFLVIYLARTIKKTNRRAMEESAKLMNRLYQAITYLRLVKTFSKERDESNRFKTVAYDVYKRAMRIAVFSSVARINTEVLGVAMVTLSLLAGGYMVLNQQTHIFGIQLASTAMDFGDVVVFFAFLIGVSDPLRKMGDVYNQLQNGIVAADRVFPLIDQVPAIAEPANPHMVPAGRLKIDFESVTFAYEPENQILKNISFSIPAGTSLAIVGHNGSGKSTLINLIPRFFDPQCGTIKINGRDIRHYSIKHLRKRIGYVTQLTMLFNDTIGSNIAYGKQDAGHAEIMDAARKAHVHEFVSSLEDGYDFNIGEHGSKLSGGQRQRLSLARTILKNPDILILDEATSQIDPESETLIHETLSEFIKNRTTILITHRLSTLQLVDRIMVMKDGTIADIGTHSELLARCPDYRRLHQVDLDSAA